MSADAKVWQGDDGWWFGVHDGPCTDGDAREVHVALLLTELLDAVERCGGYRYAWTLRQYDNGLGLAGYVAGGTPIDEAQP